MCQTNFGVLAGPVICQETYGPGKLLFGSDYQFAGPAFCLQAVRDLSLLAADEALILAANALRLIGQKGT
jgi:predicted TIM-barrel fold metal-dependent hydrolase